LGGGEEERLSLEVGPLRLLLDPASGFVRHIRYGNRLVLLGIYPAVRDHNWDTVPPRPLWMRLERGEKALRVDFALRCQGEGVDFVWEAQVEVGPQGLTYRAEGEAKSRFLRNRIGLCVLHPAECAGSPCRVETVDGRTFQGRFPRRIAPYQPFLNLRAIAHPVAEGLWAEVRLEGEVFEMEDQRNWSDASFKTYSTPLHLPFPVEVRPGERVAQQVTVRLEGTPFTPADEPTGVVRIRLGGRPRPLPQLGLGLAPEPLSAPAQRLLRALRLDHLRVDLRWEEGWEAHWREAQAQAQALGAALEAALFLPEEAVIPPRLEGEVARWLVFPVQRPATPPGLVARLRPWLRGPLYGGTDAYFAELNRARLPLAELDGVCFSLNPQVHAFDPLSLRENLAPQQTLVREARRKARGRPVAVSPLTLRPRYNPNATRPQGPLPPDPRQPSLFAAAWTAGSLKHLALGGAVSVTLFETAGPGGVLAQEEGRVWAYPLHHLLAWVGAFAGGVVLPTRSSHPLQVEALALTKGSRTRLILANLSPQPQVVRLEGAALPRELTVRGLDLEGVEEAAERPLRSLSRPGHHLLRRGALELPLEPCALLRLDAS
jgi:hypothetical protein